MIEDSHLSAEPSAVKKVIPLIAAVVFGCLGLGYAVHEHMSAQNLAEQNQQVTAQLKAERGQLDALTSKVNELATANAAVSRPAVPSVPARARSPQGKPSAGVSADGRRANLRRSRAEDQRFKKFESQLDAQGKAINDTRSDLANTRTELTGSIARTHDELVVMQRKGERNYYEFDITKSKQFKHEGPIGISLRKANTKRQYADLMLIVDDRNLSQKHVNLYQPEMFYQPDTQQPVEIIINDISKDHIHGYVSAPKYKQSELAAMSTPGPNPVQGTDQAAVSTAPQPAPRRKLTVPPDPNEQ